MSQAFLYPKPLSVMLIDDDETELFSLTQELIYGGICNQISTCSSARIALSKLEKLQEPPVLILLDLSMPQLNALDFLALYQRLPESKTANTSIVILTGFAEYKPYLISKALQYPHVIGCLSKPLQVSELLEIAGGRRQAV